MIYNNTLWKT